MLTARSFGGQSGCLGTRLVDWACRAEFNSFLGMTCGIVLAVILAVAAFEMNNHYRFNLRRFPVAGTGTLAYAEPQFFGVTWPTDALVYKTPFGKTETVRLLAQHDQYGMRSKRPISDFPHLRSVALVGDSITWGAEVDYPDTLQGQLETRFRDINVLNFGLSGSNSAYFALTTERFLPRVGKKLDAAVVGIYTDLSTGDLSRMVAIDRYGDRVIFEGVEVARSTYDKLSASQWERLSFLAHVEARRLSTTYNRLFRPRPLKEFAVSLVNERDDQRLAEWSNRLTSNLSKFAVTAHLDPSQIIVWLAPSNLELRDRWSAIGAGAPPPERVEWADRVWRGIAAQIASAGFKVLDTREAVQSLFLREGTYPYSVSGHFRPVAYKVIADNVEPHLRQLLKPPGQAGAAVESR